MMRDKIVADLSNFFPLVLVNEILESYAQLLAKHRAGELEQSLTQAGRFVEHVFRAIEYLRTRTAPSEIKQIQKTMTALENDTKLSESLRLLIPRAAYGMIYNLRSKRNVVHVKEIDPTPIDVALAVAGASWIVAELLRLQHVSDDAAVEQAMSALMRTSIPLIESLDGEVFVGKNVPAQIEMLLLLAHAKPDGVTRTNLGLSAKCSQPSVTRALQALEKVRQIHLAKSEQYFISAEGERCLANWLVEAK